MDHKPVDKKTHANVGAADASLNGKNGGPNYATTLGGNLRKLGESAGDLILGNENRGILDRWLKRPRSKEPKGEPTRQQFDAAIETAEKWSHEILEECFETCKESKNGRWKEARSMLKKKIPGETVEQMEKRKEETEYNVHLILEVMETCYYTQNRKPLAPADVTMIIAAYKLSQKLHQGQFRDDKKTPYFHHVHKVAAYTAYLGGGPKDVCAALLHDVVEEAKKGQFEMWLAIKMFLRNYEDGCNVARVIRDLTVPKMVDSRIENYEGQNRLYKGHIVFVDDPDYSKISDLKRKEIKNDREISAEIYGLVHAKYKEELIYYGLMIKAADILANLLTLQNLPEEKRSNWLKKNFAIVKTIKGMNIKLFWILAYLYDKRNEELPENLRLKGEFKVKKLAWMSDKYFSNLSRMARGTMLFDFSGQREGGGAMPLEDYPDWQGLNVVSRFPVMRINGEGEAETIGMEFEFPAGRETEINASFDLIDGLTARIFSDKKPRLPFGYFEELEELKLKILGDNVRKQIKEATFREVNHMTQEQLIEDMTLFLRIRGWDRVGNEIKVEGSKSILTEDGFGVGEKWKFARLIWNDPEEFKNDASRMHEIIEEIFVPLFGAYALGGIDEKTYYSVLLEWGVEKKKQGKSDAAMAAMLDFKNYLKSLGEDKKKIEGIGDRMFSNAVSEITPSALGDFHTEKFESLLPGVCTKSRR